MSFWSDVATSSATDEWATPRWLFREIEITEGPFDFDLDVCADAGNAKCPKFYTKEQDGLTQDWLADGPRCWMNPPYGAAIGAWMAKALEESKRGCKVTCLVPARTDTAWWHDYAAKGRVRFLRGRIAFGDAKNPAPFPSAVVVFDQRREHEGRSDNLPGSSTGRRYAGRSTRSGLTAQTGTATSS